MYTADSEHDMLGDRKGSLIAENFASHFISPHTRDDAGRGDADGAGIRSDSTCRVEVRSRKFADCAEAFDRDHAWRRGSL